MKNVKMCLIIAALFFVTTLALLRVDRQCGILYQQESNISDLLQLFIENRLDLH